MQVPMVGSGGHQHLRRRSRPGRSRGRVIARRWLLWCRRRRRRPDIMASLVAVCTMIGCCGAVCLDPLACRGDVRPEWPAGWTAAARVGEAQQPGPPALVEA
eukprot:3223492-Prorocentrum_lima.AAC.1